MAEKHVGGNPKGTGERGVVLIAEDNPMNMKLITVLISKITPNFAIVQAINGNQAIDKYSQYKPDLILMDIQMPEKGGVEAAETIREEERASGTHTPIVALTAGVLEEEKEKCMKAGMDDFMGKPIDKDKLKSMIEKYIK